MQVKANSFDFHAPSNRYATALGANPGQFDLTRFTVVVTFLLVRFKFELMNTTKFGPRHKTFVASFSKFLFSEFSTCWLKRMGLGVFSVLNS